MKRQLISCDQAVPAKGQHEKPCSDCPLSRDSLNGWLGGDDPQTWIRMLHGEARIECHTMTGAQCAGAAIYRANVLKDPRDKTILVLPQDKKAVFATSVEFLKHHEGGLKMTRLMEKKKTKHTEALASLLRGLEADRSLTKAEYHDVLCEMAEEIDARIDAAREELEP